jgi:hypothetical protein
MVTLPLVDQQALPWVNDGSGDPVVPTEAAEERAIAGGPTVGGLGGARRGDRGQGERQSDDDALHEILQCGVGGAGWRRDPHRARGMGLVAMVSVGGECEPAAGMIAWGCAAR